MVYGPIAKPHSIINWQRSPRQVQQRAGHPRNMQAGSVTPLMSEDLWPLARRSGGQRNVVSSVHGVGEKTLITRSGRLVKGHVAFRFDISRALTSIDGPEHYELKDKAA